MSRKNMVYIWSVVAFVLVFGGVASMLGHYNIGPKYTIENILTDTLGVRVTIGELHFNPEQGTARIGHLQVYNTKGFSDGAAIEIQNIDVVIDSGARGLVHLSEVTMEGVQVNLEVYPARQNLGAITYKMGLVKPSVELTDTEKLKVRIDNMSLRDNRIRPRMIVAGRNHEIIPVTDIDIAQIGEAGKGIPVKQVIRQVWNTVVPQFQKSVQEAGYFEGMEETSYSYLDEEESKGHEEERLLGE